MSERIRWEENEAGNLLGYVGTYKPWVFRLYHALDTTRGPWWLAGGGPLAGYDSGWRRLEELKAKAEELLAEFTSSLGTIFPDALRQQVQQARDIHYEYACWHAELPGHEVEEAREAGRVSAYDDVLAMLAEAGTSSGGSERHG